MLAKGTEVEPTDGRGRARCACDARVPVVNMRGGAGAAVDAMPRALIDKRRDGLGAKAVAMPIACGECGQPIPRFQVFGDSGPLLSKSGDAAWIFLRTRFAGHLQDGVRQRAPAVIKKKRGRSPATRSLVLQPCGAVVVAGKLIGAPPTETGPTGLGCRAILLRTTEDGRLRACPVVMEEVTSRVIAICSESTFDISLEI